MKTRTSAPGHHAQLPDFNGDTTPTQPQHHLCATELTNQTAEHRAVTAGYFQGLKNTASEYSYRYNAGDHQDLNQGGAGPNLIAAAFRDLGHNAMKTHLRCVYHSPSTFHDVVVHMRLSRL
jgi:hypothetical protein